MAAARALPRWEDQEFVSQVSVVRPYEVGVRDEARELALVVGVAERVVGVDYLALDCFKQGLVELLHAQVLARLDLGRNLVRLIGRDQLGDSARIDENFEDGAAATAVRRLAQHLGDDGLQAHRQERLGLFTELAGQGVDHAIDRLDRAGRV